MNGQILRQLYETYGRELLLYLYTLCGNRELAQDLMQETFVKALLSLSEEHTNMRAWLYMVARNLYYSDRRRATREVLWEEPLLEGSAQDQDLLDELIQKEEYQMLYCALSRLSPEKREILQMQYFGGIPLKQIAVILNKKAETVRVLSHRARQEVKRYMKEAGYEIP